MDGCEYFRLHFVSLLLSRLGPRWVLISFCICSNFSYFSPLAKWTNGWLLHRITYYQEPSWAVSTCKRVLQECETKTITLNNFASKTNARCCVHFFLIGEAWYVFWNCFLNWSMRFMSNEFCWMRLKIVCLVTIFNKYSWSMIIEFKYERLIQYFCDYYDFRRFNVYVKPDVYWEE